MKGANLAIAATLAAGASASGHHNHQHAHLHYAKRHEHGGSPVEKRDVYTTYVPAAVATAYVDENGKPVDNADAQNCLSDKECIIIGSSTPTFTPPAPNAYPTTSSSAGQFYEVKKTTSEAPAAYPTKAAVPAAPANGAGLDSPFPDGQIACSQFPSDYGPVSVPWLQLGGWTSLQNVGSAGYVPGVSFANIVSPPSGNCGENDFCNYACPPGYWATQWPKKSQGAAGQSVGGLVCQGGKLHLTNSDYNTLCAPGLGGITVQSQLSGPITICKTTYPGNECPNIPLTMQPGASGPLVNVDAKKGYMWQGKYTSSQFYLNNLGVGPEDSCTWKSDKYPTSSGNWSPSNIGAGTDVFGITYISLFKNLPTSTAPLNYDVEITGDITAPCWIKNNQYYGGGNGCTVRHHENSSSPFPPHPLSVPANDPTDCHQVQGRQGHHHPQAALSSLSGVGQKCMIHVLV